MRLRLALCLCGSIGCQPASPAGRGGTPFQASSTPHDPPPAASEPTTLPPPALEATGKLDASRIEAGGQNASAGEALIPADLTVTLDRGACEARCAVYKVVLTAKGRITFEGRYFLRTKGTAHGTVDEGGLRRLIEAFNAVGFFDLKDQYGYDDVGGCASVRSDAPVATTSLTMAGRSKTVVHHHRCVGPVPDRLTALEDEIDQVAGTVRWIR
jgi:Domain of unknown function (DUF6438)